MEVVVIVIVSAIIANYMHELGHLFTARLVKLPVAKVHLGVGPVIRERVGRGGARFLYGPLPGAAVLFDPEVYRSVSPFRRLIVASAGPVTNFAATFLFLAIAYILYPSSYPPVIDITDPRGAAATAGMQSGDRIVSVDGTDTHDWRGVGSAFVSRAGDTGTLRISIRRDGAAHAYEIPIGDWQSDRAWINAFDDLGFYPRPPDSDDGSGVVSEITTAFADTVRFGWSMAGAGIKMLLGDMSFLSLFGGLQLTQLGLDDRNLDFGDYLKLLALFSMAFGIINCLPGPPADGLAILFSATEVAIRRRLAGAPVVGNPPVFDNPATTIGYVLSFGPLVLCIVHDVIRFT